jgi:hypothetical protein
MLVSSPVAVTAEGQMERYQGGSAARQKEAI